MADTIESAFAHPEARIGTAPGAPDRISLRDHVVEADIGAFQQERGHRQRLRFNIAVELRARPEAGDDVDRILSYDRLTEAIAAALSGERRNLLETLAEDVAARILAEPLAARVFLRIEKLDRGPGALGVEIVRDRPPPDAPRGPAPGAVTRLLFLDNAVLGGPGLGAILDGLDGGTVLAVGFPDRPRPRTGHAPTQRRIDLLAIEQNAWTLASRDPRCVVVSSRTEIDWALGRGGLVVWAPSKLVLDSPDAPKTTDPVALALWLAGQIGASEVVLHGDVAIPATSRVPLRRA